MKERGSFRFELEGKRARTQVHPLTKIMHRVPSLGLDAEKGPLKVQKEGPSWEDCLHDHSSSSALLV